MIFTKKLFKNNAEMDLEKAEQLVLYALGALGNKPLKKLQLHKLIFFVSNVFKEYKELFDIEPHYYGPYSENLDVILEHLENLGLVERDKNIHLTKRGERLLPSLTLDPEEKKVVEEFKEFIDGLTDDELLTFVYVVYPEYQEPAVKWETLKEKRAEIAVNMLKKGKVSFGRALQISGLNAYEFEELLKKKRIKWRAI